MKNKMSIVKVNVTAMLAAIEFILTRYLKIMIGGVIRISFGFIPIAIVGILYGPLWAGITFTISDILGATLLPVGPYYPGFTLSAFLTGITFGLVLHKREVNLINIALACFIVVFGINLCLDTFWLSQIMNKGIMILLPARAIKSLIMYPIEVILIYLTWSQLLTKVPYIKNLHLSQNKENIK